MGEAALLLQVNVNIIHDVYVMWMIVRSSSVVTFQAVMAIGGGGTAAGECLFVCAFGRVQLLLLVV